jgi:predicted negative regulator of RcsB-dependent stress response
MKTAQRHQLKEDEFLVALERSRDLLAENKRPIGLIVGILAVVAIVVGGYLFWQRTVNEKAASLYADAVVTASAPVAPPTPTTPPAPGTPAPPPPPANSFPTEQARTTAAIEKFEAAAKAYPSTPAGIAANYRAATLLVESGKLAEAQARFNDVIARDGNGLHGQMARLAIASIQVENKQYDQAINTLQSMTQRADTDLPVDGILMELGDAYRRAGRLPDAVRAYTRVVNEFPKSVYLADARKQLDELKTAQEGASHS